jgi:DNA-binding CsgD family transcriptional regulator
MMQLIERDGFLELLKTQFERSSTLEGHCIFLGGEAGIGKTALIRAFSGELENNSRVLNGTCDALFTPRPLAPLYDIALQMQSNLMNETGSFPDRTDLFSKFFQELNDFKKPLLMVFEDIHWADEATLDFIKFFARRITHTRCLFILTYRNNEIHPQHPLRNIFGQLPADSFTRMQLTPLSREAVDKMAAKKGWNGENVFHISGGNPFYVNEILASYSPGIPDNIRDSILSVYNRQNEKSKQAWEILSIMPTGLELIYLEKLDPSLSMAAADSLHAGILILKEGLIFFKHELYRRTIESSLSPLLRVSLNKKILDSFLENFEQQGEIERIVHHAKNANVYDAVVIYAPRAAMAAAAIGAHIEAAKLYHSSIEYYQGRDKDLLTDLYERYAYECYLTNKIREAIIYIGKALNIWKEKNDPGKAGNCLWFLSRLWWYEASHKQAESFAQLAVEILENQPSSQAKGMAFSNMSQFRMLSGLTEEALFWGEKALQIAMELNDQRVLSHVLNNIGTVEMWIPSSQKKGMAHLEESLAIAQKNAYHEYTARAYTNLSNCGMDIKEYAYAEKMLEEGIQYCEERNLYALMSCLVSCKARLHLEQGRWSEALSIAENLIRDENLVPIAKIEVLVMAAKIKMRRGEEGALALLMEAKPKAFGILELEYMIPVMVALLEYEWITGEPVMEEKDIQQTISMTGRMGNIYKNSEFTYWLSKAGRKEIQLPAYYDGYRMHNKKAAAAAAIEWARLGCPYERALALFEGSEEDKKRAVSIVHALGALAIFEKLKQSLRASGVKNIPRGLRKSTQSNSALLTGRELDVLQLLKEGLQNKEIASRLFISPKTVDHHISSTLFKLDVSTRVKAVQEAVKLGILK